MTGINHQTGYVQLTEVDYSQHINDVTFAFFAAMELEFRRHISFTEDDSIKNKAIDGILRNDDVQVYWESLLMDWEEEVASMLLYTILL